MISSEWKLTSVDLQGSSYELRGEGKHMMAKYLIRERDGILQRACYTDMAFVVAEQKAVADRQVTPHLETVPAT